MNNKNESRVTVVMPEDLHEKLKQVAKQERRSVSAQIVVLLEEQVKK